MAGRLDEAEDALLRALRLDPRDANGLTVLGNVYANRGLHDRAVPLYERSVELERNVIALNNLAAAYARLGAFAPACTTFRDAIAEDANYPNAHYGLALAMLKSGARGQLGDAIISLERALEVLGERKRDPGVWDASQQLLTQASERAAIEETPVAAAAVRTVLVERESAYARVAEPTLPVRVEEGVLSGGALAKIEFGWVHSRPYHRLLVGDESSPDREHLVLHELEHLQLAEAARSAGTNRWFVSTEETHAHAMRTLETSLDRVRRRGLAEGQARQFVESTLTGLLGQLFNFPLDLLIETRLLARYPECRELFFQSLKRQLDTAVRIADDPDIRAISPAKIYKASLSMNVAMALWFEERFPRRTDFVERFRNTDAFDTGRRLYQRWSSAAASWTPGVEYVWVDAWAEQLGLRDWFAWTDGNQSSGPRASDGAATAADLARPRSSLAPPQAMSATFYMLAAFEWLDGRALSEIGETARNAAVIGQSGIQYDDPDSRYDLPGFKDEPISGLQLLSTMYVLVKAIAPEVDQGIDLDGPYDAARAMFATKHGRDAAAQEPPPEWMR